MNPMRGWRPRTFLALAVFLLLFLQGVPTEAYTRCDHYGQCTICDFYSVRGEYQGSVEWCF